MSIVDRGTAWTRWTGNPGLTRAQRAGSSIASRYVNYRTFLDAPSVGYFERANLGSRFVTRARAVRTQHGLAGPEPRKVDPYYIDNPTGLSAVFVYEPGAPLVPAPLALTHGRGLVQHQHRPTLADPHSARLEGVGQSREAYFAAHPALRGTEGAGPAAQPPIVRAQAAERYGLLHGVEGADGVGQAEQPHRRYSMLRGPMILSDPGPALQRYGLYGVGQDPSAGTPPSSSGVGSLLIFGALAAVAVSVLEHFSGE